MGHPVLAPVEANKHKAEPSRVPALKPLRPASIPAIPNFLGAAGNMAIQRAASGPLSGNPAASSILGGANMSGGGCSCGGGSCEECSKKPIQRKAEGDAPAPSSEFHGSLNRSGAGAPMASHTRGLMESRFNDKFEDVRIHNDGAAADAAHQIQAHAFTMGRDIYFGQGQYQPHSTAGQKLLAHELTHVLQQRRGAVPPGLKSLNAMPHEDVFEREAEQVEEHVGKEEHGSPAVIPLHRGHSHSDSPGKSVQRKCSCGGTCSKCAGENAGAGQEMVKNPLQRKAESGARAVERAAQSQKGTAEHDTFAGKSVQRKCSCGGTCSKCAGENAGAGQEMVKKPPLQRKAEGGAQAVERAVQSQKGTAEHDSFAEKSIQRKCSCGGTCSRCSGESSGPAPAELKKPPIQRKGIQDLFDAGSKAQSQGQKEISEPSSSELSIQRKCSCGGTCSKCAGNDQELKTPPIQRKAEPIVEPARDRATGPREVRPLNERGGRKEGQRSDRVAGLQPGATPYRGRGGRPIRPGRHTLPGIQRSASGQSAKSGPSARNDHFEREADAAANAVTHGRQVSPEKLTPAEPRSIQALDWEWCNPFSDPDCGLSSTASVVAGETEEIASDVWDAATEFADFVGGVLSYINNLLTITIPPMHVCDAHSIQLTLSEISKDMPFLEGELEVAEGVAIYGEVGLHLGITPEIDLQIGPCETHEITLALHPLTLSGEASGGFDLTLAGGLGGEVRAGIFGEVGVSIVWPDPPILIQVPVANIQAGLAGFVRGMVADHMSVDFDVAAGLTGFSLDLSRHDDFGFALDLGLAGYGALEVLGENLCTLYWPLYELHRDTVLSTGFSFGMEVSETSLPSLDVEVEDPELDQTSWNDMGIEFQRDMFKDDCPLCQFLRDLGLMPSNFGGTWTGHPAPPWPIGPLSVLPRDPGIPSGSLCRGACGPDCKTCAHEKEHRVCVPTPDGCHVWWVYPNYEVCNSHSGCRNHDACYDWCSAVTGFKGPLGIIISPCHRWCDFECICDYNLPQCVGWIVGKPPYDQQMVFSDAPHMEPGCRGPCPEEVKKPGGPPAARLCLPDITLVDRRSVLHHDWPYNTGDLIIFSMPLDIPYIPPPDLDVFVRGEVNASVDAGVGPVTLERLCLIYDPTTHAYAGTGSLHLKGDLNGMLTLTGILGAKAGWGCLLNVVDLEVIRGEVGLSATGLANIPLDLSVLATVSCRNGKLMLDAEAWFNACLNLRFMLDATLRVLLFRRFEVFSGRWNLIDRSWGRCWDIPIGVTSGEIGAAACGGGTAAGALGLPTPGGAPPAQVVPGPGGGSTGGATGAGPAPAAGTGLSHLELGNVETIGIPGLISDLFHMATSDREVHDRHHGLPDDPARAAGRENPCGEDVRPDDECGSPQLPNTVMSWTGSDRGEGMLAEPLTKCGPQGTDPSIRLPAWACIDAAHENSFWVHAHLLHGRSGKNDLHGPGNLPQNLILTDKSLNGLMSSRVEQGAINRIHQQGQTLSYRVDAQHVANSGDRRYFADGMRITLNRIDPVTRAVTENIFNDTIRSNNQRPIPSTCT